MGLLQQQRAIELVKATFHEAAWSRFDVAQVRRGSILVQLQCLKGTNAPVIRATWSQSAALPIRLDLTPRNHSFLVASVPPIVTNDPGFDGSAKLRGVPPSIVLRSLSDGALRHAVAGAVRDARVVRAWLEDDSWHAELRPDLDGWVGALDTLIAWGVACERAWGEHMAVTLARSGPAAAQEEERRLRGLADEAARTEAAGSRVLGVVVVVFLLLLFGGLYFYLRDLLPG